MPQPNASIDLHIHSNCSDGVLEPSAILEEAQWRGVSAVAITDHDTIVGIEEGMVAGKKCGIEVVAGVELSCRHENAEVHIVGLFIEPDAEFISFLKYLRQCREKRMDLMLAKLAVLGITLSRADLPSLPGQSLGRPHIARVLVAKKIVPTVGAAFERYLSDTGPVYVKREHLAVTDAIAAIKRMHGISILAHPGASGLVDRLDVFRDLGVQGIEAHSLRHSPAVIEQILNYCMANDLLPSGGSDFHHSGERNSYIGTPFVPYRFLTAIKERVGRA